MAAKTKADLEKELKEKDRIQKEQDEKIDKLTKMVEDLMKSKPKHENQEPTKSKLELDLEEVEVMNNTFAIGSYRLADGSSVLEFDKFGQTDFVRLGDLKKLIRSKSNRKFFEDLSLLVLDEWAIKELRLSNFYKDEKAKSDFFENLINLSAENMINEIPKMNQRMKSDFYRFFVHQNVEGNKNAMDIGKKMAVANFYKQDIDFSIELTYQRKQSGF